jgi:response regulator RpfG family c-di-GMP phosphodiesterase
VITTDDLAAAAILSALPAPLLDALASGAERRSYAEGEQLFAEGDAPQALHIVESGSLAVTHADDPSTILQVVRAGDSVGELGILGREPRTASVFAREPTTTIELAGAAIDRVLSSDANAMRTLAAALARALTFAKEELRHQNITLEERVRERTEELRDTQLEVVRRLGRAAEFRDDETGQHIVRMSAMCARLGRAIGMSEDECELLLNAAPMHDIGKLGIPDAVLLKPGRLDDAEWEVMKSHAELGAELLDGSRSDVVQLAREIALSHHERWDGSGYPLGLAGEEIPLPGRISALCDVFDALTSVRPYKVAWPVEKALGEILAQSGRHFDPELVPKFVELIDQPG